SGFASCSADSAPVLNGGAMSPGRERPIIFSAPMVRAILEGRKTQTRRAVKFPIRCRDTGCELAGSELTHELRRRPELCPYGQPGDHLWVREAWCVAPGYDGVRPRDLMPHGMNVNFAADDSLRGCKPHPSIHMP